MADRGVEFRLLGDPRILRDGNELPLPASRKTRALLCYLAATATPHRREHLCDLLWDGPNDPRAELRWSLSKIRTIFGGDTRVRLQTGREWVGLELSGGVVDLHRLRPCSVAGTESMTEAELKAILPLGQGTFLDGLELPGCFRFHQWCLGERDAVTRLRVSVLGALIQQVRDRPDEALVHARALTATDPLNEEAHATIVKALGQLGRRRDAIAYHEYARRMLETEAGLAMFAALDRARRDLGAAAAPPVPSEPSSTEEAAARDSFGPTPSDSGHPPLIGRDPEAATIQKIALAASGDGARRILLLTGEPGIGKTRLLEHLAEQVSVRGCQVFHGRSFEAESGRPYGVWIDALRGVSEARIPVTLRADLAVLKPGMAAQPSSPPDRARLFEAAAALLRDLAAGRPAVFLCDDIQWLDDASSELLHFVIRTCDRAARLTFALAGRAGELDDNPAVAGLIRFLRRAGLLKMIDLGPLSGAETRTLVQAVAPDANADAIAEAADGIPLLAVTLAHGAEDPGAVGAEALDALIEAELMRLPRPSRDLLLWAAALGRRFHPAWLAAVSGHDAAGLITALDGIERRRILCPDSAGNYVFAHDLVHRAIYRSVSDGRRRLLHRHIAQVFSTVVVGDGTVAADFARHASLAGEHRLAAEACRLAGNRCLHMLANAEAARFAALGLAHLRRQSDEDQDLETLVDLLDIQLVAAADPNLRALPDLRDDLTDAVTRAESRGLASVAAHGQILIAFLHQSAGRPGLVAQNAIRAANLTQTVGGLSHAKQMARTARCLLEVEQDIARARALLRDAAIVAGYQGEALTDLRLGQGLLSRWDGQFESAARDIERAVALAHADGLRWREFRSMAVLAEVTRQIGRPAEVAPLCLRMTELAAKLGDPVCPFAQALTALAELDRAATGWERLDSAIAALAHEDSRRELVHALNEAAAHLLRAGHSGAAGERACQALAFATSLRWTSEMAIARVLLARIAWSGGAPHARITIRRLLALATDPDRLSARAHHAIEEAANQAGLKASTLALPP